MKRSPFIIAALCSMCCIFLQQPVPAAPGDHDPTFNSALSGTSPSVYASALQPDGKVIIGGLFTTVGGSTRNNVARLNTDGSLDTAFNPNASTYVRCAAVQADGKILLGGSFTTVGGAARQGLARVHANGSLDTTFNPNPDGAVLSMAVQNDGRILIAGGFSNVGGSPRKYVARLLANGTIDTTFNPGSSADAPIFHVALQTDGHAIIGGLFSNVAGATRTGVARLNGDGSLDAGFANPALTGSTTSVICSATQNDGRVLIGGIFETAGGAAHAGIARLNANGTVDHSFSTGLDNEDGGSTAWSLALQADGKIIVAGTFDTAGGATREGLARLTATGSADPGFVLNGVATLGGVGLLGATLLADGKILIAGPHFAGTGVSYFSRLKNEASTRSLTQGGSTTLQWFRGGAAPETQQPTLEFSTNGGTSWTPTGTAARVAGGWQFTGLNLPASGSLRARARIGGGTYNGSSGLVEEVQSISVPVAYTMTASAVPAVGGSTGGGGTFSSGAGVTVTAVASPGYVFTNWTEGSTVVSTTAAYSFTAAADRTLVANFTRLSELERWRLQWFGTISNTGTAADSATPQNDAVFNLLKFATGTDPTRPGRMPGVIARNGSNLEFTYTRAKAALTDGFVFRLEWSNSLTAPVWSTVGVTETILSQDSTTQQVKDTVALGPEGKRFLRLRISKP